MNAYTNYRAVDFAQDEFFQQWVLGTSSEASAFWNHWLTQHPEKEPEVAEARQLLLTLGHAESPGDPRRAARMKRAIFNPLPESSLPKNRTLLRPRWIAASLLVVLLAGGSFWYYHSRTYVRYTTPYGETQTFVLPDGSAVTLKANSSLRHLRHWSAHPDREVWLEGEAFFHVRKARLPRDDQTEATPQFATFTVHAAEAVDVAVLGTEFNVSSRDQETEVLLKSGSVRVEVRREQPQTVLMTPGDQVAVPRRGALTRQRVDLRHAEDWRNNMLILDEVTLAEVAKKLQHTYGVKVVFQDTTLARRRFKGFVPTDNLAMLLDALTELYPVRIQRDGDRLIFSTPIPPDP